MQKVYGIIQGNTVMVEETDLSPFEGETVTVLLPETALHRKDRENEKRKALLWMDAHLDELASSFPKEFDPMKDYLEAIDEKYGPID